MVKAEKLRDCWAVRPEGELGTMGFIRIQGKSVGWDVIHVKARSEEEAIKKAREKYPDFSWLKPKEKILGKEELDLRYSHSLKRDVELFGSEEDISFIRRASKKLLDLQEPSVGDFLTKPDGSKWRLTYDWGDEIQTTCYLDNGNSDNFFLYSTGGASYSGGLNPGIPKTDMEFIGYETARFWVFRNNRPQADGGVSFLAKVRSWKLVLK